LLEAEGIRFLANGAADPAQRITVAELTSLIGVLDDDLIESGDGLAVGLAEEQEWEWERYGIELGIPEDRLAVGRKLVNQLSGVLAEMNLPWHAVFRKGYVAFQRRSGYNTLILDLYWRKAPRLAIKLPREPSALALVSPYPGLDESWYQDEREWGWTLSKLSDIPDLRPAVTIAERFHPTAGPTKDGIDREHVRQQLRSGMTPQQICEDMGDKRIYWLTAIEEEARLAGELAAYPATPDAITALRDERQLRWERIAARIYGDATRVQEVRKLYDQEHGQDASAHSYTGRGRRFPDMKSQ